MRSLQRRFLPVFWLLRMADWLQGPYFYEVYASKVVGGTKASLDLISKLFLTGFGATALFGPAAGRLCGQRGREVGGHEGFSRSPFSTADRNEARTTRRGR